MKSRHDRTDWIVALFLLVVFVVVALVWNLDKALVVGTAFGVFAAIMQTKWDSRWNWRFWVILSVFACIHVAVITTVLFPQFRAGIIAVPFALVDGLLMLGLINWVEKRFPCVVIKDSLVRQLVEPQSYFCIAIVIDKSGTIFFVENWEPAGDDLSLRLW